MSKKWKIFLAVIAGIVVLSLAGGAVALADSAQSSMTSNPYLAAVATKLNITEQALTDAMKQAQQQLAATAIDQALANAVTKGTITQAESDAIKAWLAQQPTTGDKQAMKDWWNQRPQLANNKVYNGFIWKAKITRMQGWCYGNLGINNTDFINKVATILGKQPADVQAAFQSAASEMKTAAFTKAIDNAVTNGKLTQDEANQIKSWWAQRPAALDKLAPGFGLKGGIRGMMRGMMKGFGGTSGGTTQQSTTQTQ